MTSSSDAETVIDVAVWFVATQVGGWERTLARHQPLPSGLCGGCSSRPVRWPCSVASIADKARERQARGRAGMPATSGLPGKR
jgi:hypothetical protein